MRVSFQGWSDWKWSDSGPGQPLAPECGPGRPCRKASGSFSGQCDADGGVVPADARLGLVAVDAGALVLDLGHVGEDAEAAGETGRRLDLLLVLRRRFDAEPLAAASASPCGCRRPPERRCPESPASACPWAAATGSAGRAARPSAEREWLSWTKSTGSPRAWNWSARNTSIKKPRSSSNTSGSRTTRPLRCLDAILICIACSLAGNLRFQFIQIAGKVKPGPREAPGSRPSGGRAPITSSSIF